ncbi:MAG: hypothetical protein ABJG78_13240 [Cyclobacteriaceae bacterium]
MTETTLSLVGIIAGIVGANLVGFVFKKYSLGLTGNTIAGVFGSILLLKSIGRLGVDPVSIMQTGQVNILLLVINILLSTLGGLAAVVVVVRVKGLLGSRM